MVVVAAALEEEVMALDHCCTAVRNPATKPLILELVLELVLELLSSQSIAIRYKLWILQRDCVLIEAAKVTNNI